MRAEFCGAGGAMLFTILTILKPTRKITSEKTGPFFTLRCRAMKNSTPRKSQNTGKSPAAENPKTATEMSDW
jgi:hypothetical protein